MGSYLRFRSGARHNKVGGGQSQPFLKSMHCWIQVPTVTIGQSSYIPPFLFFPSTVGCVCCERRPHRGRGQDRRGPPLRPGGKPVDSQRDAVPDGRKAQLCTKVSQLHKKRIFSLSLQDGPQLLRGQTRYQNMHL